MAALQKLEGVSHQNYFQGKIVEVTDGSIVIEFDGRLGELRIPKRMLICENNPEIGQEVGLMMTYPEVLE